jgi:hypothetical protein
MKKQTNDKPGQGAGNPPDQHTAGLRAHVARTFEHRNKRRKIHEQLKRLDWVLDAGDMIERWRRLDCALNEEEDIFA